MNIVILNNKVYKYESFWRDGKQKRTLDSKGHLFPWPKGRKNWQNRFLFLQKLKTTHNHLKKKIIKYKPNKYKNCLICGKKNITKGLFELNRIRWETGLFHYIDKHNIKPTDEFVDRIFRFQSDPKTATITRSPKIKGIAVKKHNMIYLKINRNQLLIMDALMQHGSRKAYIDERNKTVFRFSEHAGLLDFNNDRLERLIISANTNRIDDNDDDIFLPSNMIDAFDYEYIFHTHPATPHIGSRAIHGILYEFPSISDIFHFMDHYNDGRTQGSIIIAPEGMYNIRKYKFDKKQIKINEDRFYKQLIKTYRNVQNSAIKKYGTTFTADIFHTDISPNLSYINKVNKELHKFKMHIDYYPRKKDKIGHWIIDTVYLPVYVIEPSRAK